jgi:hypothetical protein
MPKGLISVSALLCERVLTETDKVMSAIRIVDILFVPPKSQDEYKPVLANLLLIARFEPDGAEEHTVEVRLLRPDGELQSFGDPRIVSLEPSPYPGTPIGINLVAQMWVTPHQTGIHYIVAYVDGEEVTRVPYSIIERPAQAVE